jgi:hypothetical protein
MAKIQEFPLYEFHRDRFAPEVEEGG